MAVQAGLQRRSSDAGSSAKVQLAMPASQIKDALLEVLEREIGSDASGFACELGSGSGEHIAHFAPRFQHLIFQPSDVDESARKDISSNCDGLPNVLQPANIDALSDDYGKQLAQSGGALLVLAINLLQFGPEEMVEQVARNASALLLHNGFLLLYGPFTRDGQYLSENDRIADTQLKEQHAAHGVKDIDAVTETLERHGFKRHEMNELAASQLCVLFQKA